MASHQLSLNIPEILNDCILSVQDTSIYAEKLEIDCEALQVTVPGFTTSVNFEDLESGFPNMILTACSLGLQTTECSTNPASLPDGIYVLRYSVAPNDIVYVEYNHLRRTSALKKLQGLLCDLDLSDCEPSDDLKKQMKEIDMIRIYLDAAKAEVEVCHNPEKGMSLFNYALNRLDKLNCTNCY